MRKRKGRAGQERTGQDKVEAKLPPHVTRFLRLDFVPDFVPDVIDI